MHYLVNLIFKATHTVKYRYSYFYVRDEILRPQKLHNLLRIIQIVSVAGI